VQLRDELRPIRHLSSFLHSIDPNDTDADPSAPIPASADPDGVPASSYASSVSSIAALASNVEHHATTHTATAAGAAGAAGSAAAAAAINSVDEDGDELSDKVDGGGGGGLGAGGSVVAGGASSSTAAGGAKKRKRKSESQAPIICSYSDGRPCKSRAQIGSKFCYHHQPMDPNSEYVTCEFQSKKKCSLPVRKDAPRPRLCKRHQPVDPTVAAATAAAAAALAAAAGAGASQQ
jgi:hypothetical protein